jgi:hypothetical protein
MLVLIWQDDDVPLQTFRRIRIPNEKKCPFLEWVREVMSLTDMTELEKCRLFQGEQLQTTWWYWDENSL